MSEHEGEIEKREAAIRLEIGDRWEDAMNNFHNLVLPDRYPRYGAEKQPDWNRPHGEVYPEAQASELYGRQTEQEFYQVIDTTIAELDKDGEVRKLIEQLSTPPHDWEKRNKLEPELKKKLFPIFIRLVALGYKRSELAK